MNEEIARILQMLDEGKIDAEGAERLIRAVHQGARKGPPGTEQPRHRPPTSRDISHALRDVARTVRRGMLAQRRQQWWRYYQYSRGHEADRARRAATLSTAERVRYVLTDRVMVDEDDLKSGTRLAEDLRIDRTGLEVLAWALRDELGVEPHVSALRDMGTVEALVEWVSARKGEGAPAQTPTEPTPAPEETAPAEPPAD